MPLRLSFVSVIDNSSAAQTWVPPAPFCGRVIFGSDLVCEVPEQFDVLLEKIFVGGTGLDRGEEWNVPANQVLEFAPALETCKTVGAPQLLLRSVSRSE